MAVGFYNAPVEGVSFFSPKHLQSPGTPVNAQGQASTPTLFTPLKIRASTLRNRICVAPMCQYSTADTGSQVGALTPYHIMTLGHYALKGAALVFIEATGVQPNGRISPNCPGLWDDAQIAGVQAVAEAIRSQGALCGIQLAHAGRKASSVAPWIAAQQKRSGVRATKELNGWPDDVVGPTGGEDFVWDGKGSDDPNGAYWAPRALSQQEIKQLVGDWANAAARAVKAGVDLIEIHAAHGYLIHQFLSPITNHRTDEYGGSFEGRTRLLLEIIKAIREVIPSSMPLFLRVSSTEWLEKTEVGRKFGTWTAENTIELAKIVAELGVDLLDVSSGGNHPDQQINPFSSGGFQVEIASRIRNELKASGKNLLVGAVGLITQAEQAKNIVDDQPPTLRDEAETAKEMLEPGTGKTAMADVVLIARQFMREPEWVLRAAWALGLEVAWPIQFGRVRFSEK